MKTLRLIALAPGHFHAALLHKKAVAGVHSRIYVYGPFDRDTVAHLERLAAFNTREDQPTAWEVDLRAGPNWLERFTREQPGNVVVLSGCNRPKIDLMRTAVSLGLHVLADKPWIIEPDDFPKLEEVYREAELREVLVWDMMTERFEVANRLQRELVQDPNVFGHWQTGSPQRPALVLESVHYLKKRVDGRPLVRPWWWFDPATSGEALADVGTHLVDRAIGLIAPDCPLDWRTDARLLSAESWPLPLDEEQFAELTGLRGYPAELAGRAVNGVLYYAGNNTALFTLRGVHVRVVTQWDFETPAGGSDVHRASALGSLARVEVRQEPTGPPDVYVVPHESTDRNEWLGVLTAKCEFLQGEYPGLVLEDRGREIRLVIPAGLRTGHESHFSRVFEEFVRYFNSLRSVPRWEQSHCLTKYYLTTAAIGLSRRLRAANNS